MRLLLDENLSARHTAALQTWGHDAVSVVGLGMSGASDSEVRAKSIAEDRILVTLDADFANILRFPPTGTPGIIWLRVRPPTEDKIAIVLYAVHTLLLSESLDGRLAVVDEEKVRIRKGLEQS